MNTLSDSSNKDKIAIVAVGYNRKKSLDRLLKSLNNAIYDVDVPLYISIDASGDEDLYDYVKQFPWGHGSKYINIQEKKLGLKNHIFQCGDLTKFFKAIVLLEDDLYVSPFFFEYVRKSVERYGDNPLVAEISLYRNEYNGYVGLPLTHQQTGSDTYLMQDVSTWGQIWTEQMWTGFKEWMGNHDNGYYQCVDMPGIIKAWANAWSKYYNAYVVDTHKYVVYPSISVTTNFSDGGVHGGTNNTVVQVNLLDGPKNYNLGDVDKLVRYDIYYNNEELYDWLGLSKEDVCLDLYGFHERVGKERYILSVRRLGFKIINQYALNLRPIELNIKYNIKGKGIFLYDTQQPCKWKESLFFPSQLIEYYLQGFRHKFLIRATVLYYLKRIKEKIIK